MRIYKNSLAGIIKKSGFALPTVLIASVIMLSVLAFAAASSSTVRTNLDDQYYNQLAQTAGDAGSAYAKVCLASNGGAILWGASRPLKPDTDCSGNPLSLTSCPISPANASCHFVMLNGNYFTTFKVDYPSSGNVSDIVSSGSTGLLRSSDVTTGTVGNPWRQYNQSSYPNLTSIGFTPTISGFTVIGSDLTVGNIPSEATVSYQWQRASSFSGVYANIPGATSSTYTPDITDLGQYIKVSITGIGRYSGSSVTSVAQNISTSCLATATGGTFTDSGGFRTYKYNSVGVFTFVPSSPCKVEILVVAGGGGGGGAMGGGGGAGGLLYNLSMDINAQSYSVTVGKGGVGGSGMSFKGSNGDPSLFGTLLSASGGGGGGYYTGSANPGLAGGSGGGGGGYLSGAGGIASPSGQGNAGGAGNSNYLAGGGGGAGGAGQAGQAQVAGYGGNGLSYSISGTATYYAGGGGGGGYSGITCTGGAGGLGGGGIGTCSNSGSGAAGVINTGGGGGGGGYQYGVGGAGGSGIVIIRYKI